MDIKTYIDFVIRLIERRRLEWLRVIIYISIAFILSPILNYVVEILVNGPITQNILLFWNYKYIPYTSTLVIGICWIIFWIILISLIEAFVASSIKIWDFLNKYLHVSYKLSEKSCPSNWLLQGGIRLGKYFEGSSQKTQIIIARSNSGCLIKDKFLGFPMRWKNFESEFDLIFPQSSDRAVGIIFRAQDLENYFMIQIRAWNGEDYKLMIKPHIRMYGNWEVIDLNEKELENIDTFDSPTDTLHVLVKVEDIFAHIFIKDKLVYTWTLPSNTEPNLIQHAKPDDKISAGLVPEIPFRKIFGMFGFRAYPGENAIIRNLEIRTI